MGPHWDGVEKGRFGMRKLTAHRTVAAIAITLAGVAGLVRGQSTSARSGEAGAVPSGTFGVAIDVTPVEGEAGVYLCNGVVTDLATSKVLSKPSVKLKAGKPAIVRSGIVTSAGAASLNEIKITVEVGSDARTVSYTTEITRAGEVVSSQKATIRLR
jgi:hypothetical protein